MPRRFSYRWLIALVPLALILSACGLSLSGEPKTVSEVEIPSLPTATPAEPQTPVATSAEPSTSATPQGTTSATPAGVEGTPGGLDLASADFNQGMQIFLDQCAACHGAADGTGPSLGGMGERAATRIPGMAAADYLYQSIIDPNAYTVPGYQNVMPTDFAQKLTPQQISSLVTFILEFNPQTMMSGAVQLTPAPESGTPEVAPQGTLTVRGHLIRGTANGAPIPPGLAMQLYALDVNGNLIGVYETTSDADGGYEFQNVARAAGDVYLVQVQYADVPQGAQISAIQGDEQEITRDVTVYERTTDPSSIAITWMQMLVNYAPINQFGIEVWLRLELANTGDQIVTTDEKAGPNDWFVSVKMDMPVGSFGIEPMQTEGSQRYVVAEVNGVPVVSDTWPLRPGQAHSITIAYYLPYKDGAVLDQSFNYPVVDASVLLPNDTVSFKSDQFDSQGVWRYRVDHGGVRVTELEPSEQIDPASDFTLVKSYDLLKPLPTNERMIFELAGRPTRTIDLMSPTSKSSSTGRDNTLPMILGAAGVAVIALAGGLYWRQRKTVPPPTSGRVPVRQDTWQPPGKSADKETLLKAVADLDDAYEAGELDDETYHLRRDLLMERLLPLMEQDSD
jgi:mono/diheme cytochrome c family protein